MFDDKDFETAVSQAEFRRKLVRLLQENPNLPLYGMVDGEFLEDGYAWMIGDINGADIREFVQSDVRCEGRIYFKDDTSDPNTEADITQDDIDILYNLYPDEAWEVASDARILAQYKAIKWRKAIFISIST